MNVTREQINEIASLIGIEGAALMAFIATESPMKGFQDGKLLIQFEPAWFRKKEPYAPSGKWSVNKIEVQSKEWKAFNNAFSINPKAAMESTSIGLPQILGLHWKRLGYGSVNEMWDDFKTGELAQVKALGRYIATDNSLLSAIRKKDWHKVASLYNGSKYKELAKKIGRTLMILPYRIITDYFCKKISTGTCKCRFSFYLCYGSFIHSSTWQKKVFADK